MAIPSDPVVVCRKIVAALAEVRAIGADEIMHEVLLNDGDLEIDSLEGVSVIARLETEFDSQLPGLDRLRPEQCTSISALTELFLTAA